jgi:hypothetical protein
MRCYGSHFRKHSFEKDAFLASVIMRFIVKHKCVLFILDISFAKQLVINKNCVQYENKDKDEDSQIFT